MRRIFALSLLLVLGACASPMASMQPKYVVGQGDKAASIFNLHICRPSSSEHFYKSVGFTVNGDLVAEIGSGESLDIALRVDDNYILGFYPPEINMLIKMMGREKAFGISVDGKKAEIYVILSTDNLMLSIEQEKTDVIKNYYEVAIYPWQVRVVKKPLFESLCGEIKKTYLFKQ